MKATSAAVIEPKTAVRQKLVSELRKAGLRPTAATTPEQLRNEPVIILGPSVKGSPKLAKQLRGETSERLVLCAQRAAKKPTWADAVLPLPLSAKDLAARLPELWALQRAKTGGPPVPRAGEGILDPLTSFYTFAHFKEVLFVEVKRARRYGFPLSLALVSFDPMKVKPDRALVAKLQGGLALSIRRSLRDTDFPVQYSDDRVLLLMPHTDLQGGLVVTRRICERIAKAELRHGKTHLRPTISVGVSGAARLGPTCSFSDLARGAQQSLEQAMARGGNRVEFSVLEPVIQQASPLAAGS